MLRFPRLVECFHDIVIDVALRGTHQKFAHETRLRERRCERALHAVALTRPADFADHYFLFRIRSLQIVEPVEHVVKRVADRQAFPVRQQVHGDE